MIGLTEVRLTNSEAVTIVLRSKMAGVGGSGAGSGG